LRLTSLLALVLAAGSILPAPAQIRSGSVVGTVIDSSGAAVVNATVEISLPATGASYKSVTNDSGQYTLPYLQLGTYTLTVRKTGFKTAEITGIQVATGETIRVPVSLEVGAVTASVEVTADAAGVEIESASVQGVAGQQLVENLPNLNDNPFYFATLMAGVVGREELNDGQSVNAFGIGIDGRRNFSAISVNGGQAFTNDIQVNGVSVQGSAWNEAAVVPNRDSVQEVRAITNNFSAEYGRAQGVLQLTTRSGTNQYHGTVFDRVRNDFFAANSFNNNTRGITRPAFKVNTFGATLGGRVPHTRLFFFASYEGLVHHRRIDYSKNVPTTAERKGDFSASRVSVNGVGVPLELFDPFSAVETDKNVYTHLPIPNAVIPNPDPYSLKLVSYFPLPNHLPDSVFGTNNYLYSTLRKFDKHSFNSRVDYQWGKHSLYGTGGLTKGLIDSPSSWGPDNPFQSRNEFIGRFVNDSNPFGAIGDTVVLSPSTVMDIRYGLNRIHSNNEAEIFPNLDYSQFGIPKDIQAINAVPGAAPEFAPGGNLSALNQTNSLHKRERQTNHQLVGSVTKTHNRWIFKFGTEYRVMLSNYIDAEESAYILTSAGYTRQLSDAVGGAIGSPLANVAGYSPASFLLGAGNISVAAGRGVKPALAQKYFALYSQNDWRATKNLTIFLGLRWDLQPGPTDRFNRMSAFDLAAKNPYNTAGAYAFPGQNGYSRNLWDTHYGDWGPRLGFGYKLTRGFVVRGGYGLSYLPTNTGYFDGPFTYGMDTFSAYTTSDLYGANPQGVVAGKYYEVNRVVQGSGPDPRFPGVYGNGQLPRFDRHGYLDGRSQQWNFVVESHLGRDWQISATYSGSKGDHLPFARFGLNNNQLLPDSVLQSWRQDYIARNGRGYLGSDQVPNPFQPANAPLIPFNSPQGRSTMALQDTLQPYALFGNIQLQESFGFSRYDSLILQVNHRFSKGLQLSAHYTWSKSTDFTQTEAQTNGYADTGGYLGSTLDYHNHQNNKKLSLTDVPHRFVSALLYELPVGKGKALHPSNRLLNWIASGWKTSGAFTAQRGFPVFVSGANTGALNARPDRVPGQSLEVPKELQHWYDGRTRVTLPNGQIIQPCAFCFLKYNVGAFQGRVITTPSGTAAADLFWTGTAALDYADLRGNGRWNLNASLNRTFRVTERFSLDFSAQSTNTLNHPEFRAGINGGLGAVNLVSGGAQNLVPGVGQSGGSFGTYGMGTFDPREVVFELKVRF
jgi:trimeric autotransporter adhesin